MKKREPVKLSDVETAGAISDATKAKEAGNAAFSTGAMSMALACYARTRELCKAQRAAAAREELVGLLELDRTATSNMAAVYLKTALPDRAEACCTEALDLAEDEEASASASVTAENSARLASVHKLFVKLYFRRASARELLRPANLAGAMQDCAKAQEYASKLAPVAAKAEAQRLGEMQRRLARNMGASAQHADDERREAEQVVSTKAITI